MELSTLDLVIIFGFFAITLLIGIVVSKKAGKNSSEFFLSGRNMPWWLLGVSMVATTFAADTPNLVAGIVRVDGIAGNWVWLAFLLTGMVTVFIYAKLWRKLDISTDLEYYEIRYKGKAAAFLRGFRAVYLGVFFNIVIMATVCLAGVKIGQMMLGLSAFETLGIASVVTVLYSLLGGLKGVIITDFFQFIIAMVGSIWAAYFIVDIPEIGGMTELVSNPVVQAKLDFVPDRETNYDLWVGLIVIPLAVQWWSVWYPGAEPGGGGYIAQRMLAAKDEKHATAATLFFNFAHYALRPWPWIIIALASLVIFPMQMDLNANAGDHLKISPDSETFLLEQTSEGQFAFFEESSAEQVMELQAAAEKNENTIEAGQMQDQANRISEINQFVTTNKNDIQAQSLVYLYAETNDTGSAISGYKNAVDLEGLVALQLYNPDVKVSQIQHDLSYPAMISLLPAGLLGLILASLISAFMSTISTHLNWGSSYVVNDFYKRFMNPEASEKKLVGIGRISTFVMMLLAALLSAVLSEAKEAFDLILQIGAGTGLLFIMRWFWKAINPISEITAMSVSFLVAIVFFIGNKMGWGISNNMQLIMGVVITTVAWVTVTLLTQNEKYLNPEFDKRAFDNDSKFKNMGYKVLSIFLGCIAIYSALFSVGNYLLGEPSQALYFLIAFIICSGLIATFWKRLFA